MEKGQVISGEFAQLIAVNIQANCVMGEPGQIAICSHVDITRNLDLHMCLQLDSLVLIMTAKTMYARRPHKVV